MEKHKDKEEGQVKTRLKNIVIALFVVAFILGGCAAGTQLKNPSEMTPKEKATFAMKLFVKQTQDLQATEKLPLTPEQKSILAQKREFLKKTAITLDMYNGYIDGGLQPTPALEAAITDIINQMLIK